ncbi:Hypothetical predicted protein [Paramuricea clavata]|uniref:Uncharacterized protein n=1 Tax=Paramuricea clavata TaxID=317549 RepID=A0A6S7H9B7_PARCT|nr:Hypothetical predicted protein [Paramuricea clavata]
MFVLGVIFLLSCSMSQSMPCDLTKEHPVIDKTSNKTLGCMKCRTCKSGKELKIPCGTPVGRFEQVGDCRPCKNGTYSATEDSRECQVCRSEKCFKHQVIKGTCLTNRRDETYCIDKCDNGYVMNKEGTACEVLTPQQNTPEKPTTSNPTTSNPTANPTRNNLTTSNPTTSNPTTSNPTTSNLTTSNPTANSIQQATRNKQPPTTSNPTTSNPLQQATRQQA